MIDRDETREDSVGEQGLKARMDNIKAQIAPSEEHLLMDK
jgi:hypothetical protein